jgi:hypothetical protein
MPRPGFYNDNEYRAYPFVFKPDITALPESTIVDLGVVMRIDAAFDDATHVVWLDSITREGDIFRFDFYTSSSPEPLVFFRSVDAQEWQIEYAESSAKTTGAVLCPDEPVWEGFLVTGPLGDLNKILSADDTLQFTQTDYRVEPARIQNLNKAYLRTISVGNYERVKIPACGEGSLTDTITPKIIVNKQCMAGDLKFKEGYNCQIDQVDWNNELIIGASTAGNGLTDAEICETGSELPLYAGETPPEGSQFLGGGPACDELIFTLNGAEGPNITLIGGPGISVSTQTSPPKITITRNTSTFRVCDKSNEGS